MARRRRCGYRRPVQREPAAAEAPAPTAEAAAPVRAPALDLAGYVIALQRTAGNRATARALARAPLDNVPAAQRTGLREVTDALQTIDVTALHTPPGVPGTRTSGQVSPAPVFGTGIGTALQPVLISVLHHLLGGALPQNTTSAVVLDLTPYGGSRRVYRFTHVISGDPPQTSYFIDEVGTEAAAPAPPADATAAFPTGRFDSHRFSVAGSDRDFEAVLRAAVQMIPDALLTPIDGVTFHRATTDPHDARVGGRYDHQAHTVTIYDPGMRDTTARFGDTSGAVGPRIRTILHELGHAIDEAPLHQAWTARETARVAVETRFAQYLQPDGSYSFPGNLQAEFNRLHGAATRADTAYTNARSRSGHDHEHGDTDAATATATDFTRAVTADGGVTLTAYAESSRAEDHHLRETYAEAFSMFITEPQTLRAMRPNLYAYFAALGTPRRGR
jgi:hypothetical protein